MGCDRAPRMDLPSLAHRDFRRYGSLDQYEGRNYAFAARDTRTARASSVYDFLARFNRGVTASTKASGSCTLPSPAAGVRSRSVSQAAHRAPPFFNFWPGQTADTDVAAPDSVTPKPRLHLPPRCAGAQRPAGRKQLHGLFMFANVADAALALPTSERWRAQWASSGTFYLKPWPPYFAPGPSFAPVTHHQVRRALVDAGAVEDADGGATLTAVASRLANWFELYSNQRPCTFLFAPTHQSSAQEFTLQNPNDPATGSTAVLRIDHTFVAADGVRWIVDLSL